MGGVETRQLQIVQTHMLVFIVNVQLDTMEHHLCAQVHISLYVLIKTVNKNLNTVLLSLYLNKLYK